jgi:hypothetical protein
MINTVPEQADRNQEEGTCFHKKKYESQMKKVLMGVLGWTNKCIDSIR